MDSSMGKMTRKLVTGNGRDRGPCPGAGDARPGVGADLCRRGGADVGGNCTISTAITAFCPFNLTVPGDLLITSTGSIDCGDPVAPPGAGAQPITISVGGDMEMQAGSSILAEKSLDGGNGGNIAITVGGDFTIASQRRECRRRDLEQQDGPRQQRGREHADHRRQRDGQPGRPTITCATTPAGDILEENGARILANNADGVAGNIKMFAGKNATINGDVLAWPSWER